jgi:hypothetical protein
VSLDPVEDAMAYITAFLPADDAARTWAVIDGAARAMRAAGGESRTLNECRRMLSSVLPWDSSS